MERAWLCSDGCWLLYWAKGSICRALALALPREIPQKAADIHVLGTLVCPHSQWDHAATRAQFKQNTLGVCQRRWQRASSRQCGVSTLASFVGSVRLLKWELPPWGWYLGVCDLRQRSSAPGTSLQPLKELLSSTWLCAWWEWEKGPRFLISYFIILLQYCGWLSSWEWFCMQFWFCKLLRDRSL